MSSDPAVPMGYLGPGQGRRIANGTRSWTYNATGIAGTSDSSAGSSSASFITTPDGGLIGEIIPAGSPGCTGTSTCAYYYLFDGLGLVIGLTDSNGTLVDKYSYGPYGVALTAVEAVPNPFRYISAIWDSNTGLYKMGERYYDPTVGRFTQDDPLGGGYGYAGGDPVNSVDPSGLLEEPPMGVGPGIATPQEVAADTLGYGSGEEGITRPGKYARESVHVSRPGRRPTSQEQRRVDELGRKYGCHRCGSKDPGTRSGHFVADHQPANSVRHGREQEFYPHCLRCSKIQGAHYSSRARRHVG